MEEIELFDRYNNKQLSERERLAFEQRLSTEEDFRQRAKKHFHFIESLQRYDSRKELKQTLNRFHEERNTAATSIFSFFRKQATTLAIAATVAVITSTAVLLLLQPNEQREKYQELRKNVEQLKKSQKKILEDIKSNRPATTPGKYSGSGFLVSSQGYLLTSYHVVKKSDSIFIENEKYGRLKALLIFGDASTDVALLQITDTKKKFPAIPFVIRVRECSLGEEVYTLGYPRNEIVYGDGTISATTGFEQNINSYQVSIPVNPGNSGGPMIDAQGTVIGIINGAQPTVRSAAFAIKSQAVLDRLKNIPDDSLKNPLRLNTRNQLSGLSRVEQIKRWRDFVFVVKVY
jgi:serine protease Do